MQANEKSAPTCFRVGDAVSKQRKMGRMPTVRGAEDHNAVSKQPIIKMMLTEKADLEVMMLHQIGRKWSWCQQKSREIEERCWHQGRNMPRWYSIFPSQPSHHHEKASKWYSIGIPGTEKHIYALPTQHGFYESRHGELKNAIMLTIVFTLPGCHRLKAATRISQICFIRIVCHQAFSQLPLLESLWH